MKTAWIHAAACGAVILVLTSLPTDTIPLRDTFDVSDAVVHAVMYTILGLLVVRAASRTWSKSDFRIYASNAWLITAGFGGLDELHQALIPYRTCSLWDWIADAVGALIALGIWWIYTSRSAQSQQHSAGDGGSYDG